MTNTLSSPADTSGRLPLVDPTTASPAIKAALDKLPVINLFRAMAGAETLYPPFIDYVAKLFQNLELDPATERMAVLLVGKLSDCFYVWRQNVVVAQSVGVTPQQIDALDAGRLDDESFTSAQRAVFAFTVECVRDIEVTTDTYAQTAELLSPRQIAELLYVVGTYMMICRFVRSGHVPLDDKPAASPNQATAR